MTVIGFVAAASQQNRRHLAVGDHLSLLSSACHGVNPSWSSMKKNGDKVLKKRFLLLYQLSYMDLPACAVGSGGIRTRDQQIDVVPSAFAVVSRV